MALPIEILYGIYLGVLTGIIPALIAGVLGFVFKYFTDVTIPGFGVVVLSLAIAGVNGGLLALSDESIVRSERAPALVTAIIVVLMLSLYAHAQGDKLGGSIPRRVSLQTLRTRTLSTDVVELVGGRRQVRVTIDENVSDIEGYPPLSADLRAQIADNEWQFPADLLLSELETRVADRLRSAYGLADVSVALDEHARATVAAAPPAGALSKRIEAGKRAVSVRALLPTGMVRGESLTLHTTAGTVRGALLSAPAAVESAGDRATTAGDGAEADGGVDDSPSSRPTAAVTAGGEGRITVAVDNRDAKTLLRAAEAQLVVGSRGTQREFELLRILRRAGARIKRCTLGADNPFVGATVGAAAVHETHGVHLVAVRDDRWQIAPAESIVLTPGMELYVVGPGRGLDEFVEVATR
ncbi:TrkA C-terminal domain-containing protein [Haloferacaceae archaeon DSL9]